MKTPSHVVASYPSITQLIETLSLQAKGKRTCEEYVRYVRKLAQHSGGDPALLDEVRIRAYLIAPVHRFVCGSSSSKAPGRCATWRPTRAISGRNPVSWECCTRGRAS